MRNNDRSVTMPRASSEQCSTTKLRNVRDLLASLLLVLPLFLASAAPAIAQQLSGTEPGDHDPVGAPAAYLTLRTDDLLIGKYTAGNMNELDTYEVDTAGKLSNQIPDASGPGVLGGGSSITASGRILSQENDQAVNAGRSADGSSLEVRFPSGGGVTELPGLHAPILGFPDKFPVPDQFSLAVGDLDQIPDENGVNHDEVVAVYAKSPPPGSPFYNWQLAVLNYGSVDSSTTGKPLYVTMLQAQTASPLSFTSTISETVSVAIGDFDGSGQNEIAFATLWANGTSSPLFDLQMFRYQHGSLSDTPTLQEVSHTQFNLRILSGGGSSAADLLPTISLMAGDFAGTGKAQLVVALQNRFNNGNSLTIQNVLQAIDLDANLKSTLKGLLVEKGYIVSSQQGTLTPGRVIGLAGLFKYDPANQFDLYRREIALVSNERQPVNNDSNAKLDIDGYSVASDLQSFTPLFNSQKLQLQAAGVGAKFDATAGGLAVNQNIATPVWTLAVGLLASGTLQEAVTTVSVGSSLAVASTTNFASGCCGGGTVATDNAFRPTVQATDYGVLKPALTLAAEPPPTNFEGRTVVYGAPIRIQINNVINTDFVLEEPPKHTYWDENAQKLVVINRFPQTAASLTTTAGTTYASNNTDMSGFSVGGSEELSASSSTGVGAGADVGGVNLLAKTTSTVDVSEKSSYNYDHNKSNYNSNYASRTITETDSTDNDDFISGRVQTFDIWRYRELGIEGQTLDGSATNAYYDVVLPGPTLPFFGGGLNLPWYQPLHENGNILSYPEPSNNTFTPPDIGTYGIPCPPGAMDCSFDGIETQTGPMIPSSLRFMDSTSGSTSLDYSNSTGSGNTISYQHKVTASLDIKYSYTSDIGNKIDFDKFARSADVTLSGGYSTGNTTTSDSTTTTQTGITISRYPVSSNNAYAYYPTLYTTLDGTIKLAHAADPLGSSSGKQFWASLYGAKPDPALNLPLRFVIQNNNGSGTTWIPNTTGNDYTNRKKMRGFLLLSPNPDPVTGEYNILAQAPVDGDQVRLSAQVYNYSTAQSFSNCLVQFYKVKYDSGSDKEIGPRELIGSTNISSLDPRATAPAQIIWNTTGSGPDISGGAAEYRIYVVLNGDKKIDELYPAEDPTKQYAPGLPVGLDPGQNNEGWGLATVMAKDAPGGYGPLTSVRFGKLGLAIQDFDSSLTDKVESAPSNGLLQLRSEVCVDSFTRDPIEIVVFDRSLKEPDTVIAWQRVYVSGKGKCGHIWFSWMPTRGEHQLVATILPTGPAPTLPNNVPLPSPRPLLHALLNVNVPG